MLLLRYLQRGSRGTLESPATDLLFSTGVRIRSDLQQATPERDGDRMGPIVGLQFIHQVLDMEVNRGLRNRQLIRNLLVAIAIANESKDLQLPGRKIVLTQMLG